MIAYQARQSFKPGEVTPEEANRIGYEFAMRFLKSNHAFIVCTQSTMPRHGKYLRATKPPVTPKNILPSMRETFFCTAQQGKNLAIWGIVKLPTVKSL